VGVVWYAIAAMISWSRLDQGAHFAYQIIGGIVLGFACAIVGARLFPSLEQDSSEGKEKTELLAATTSETSHRSDA
jgi:membrane-associated phospholipid phosphatase